MTSRTFNAQGTTRSSANSTPLPPPKPSHLSSAFTGTLNSEALRNYIQAQKTGDSINDSNSNTFTPNKVINTTTSRAKALKDLYTSPNIENEEEEARIFNSLVRDEVVSIDGIGPTTSKSVVQGWLRSTGAGAPIASRISLGEEIGKIEQVTNSDGEVLKIPTSVQSSQDVWAGAENEVDSDEDDTDGDGTDHHSRYLSTTSQNTFTTISYRTANANSDENLGQGVDDEDDDQVGEISFHDRDESTATVRGYPIISKTQLSGSENQIINQTSPLNPNHRIPSNSSSTAPTENSTNSPNLNSDDATFQSQRPSSVLSNTTTERSRAPSILSSSLRVSGFFREAQNEATKGFDLERRTFSPSPDISSSSSPVPGTSASPSPAPEELSEAIAEGSGSRLVNIGDGNGSVRNQLKVIGIGPPPLRPKSLALDLDQEIGNLEKDLQISREESQGEGSKDVEDLERKVEERSEVKETQVDRKEMPSDQEDVEKRQIMDQQSEDSEVRISNSNPSNSDNSSVPILNEPTLPEPLPTSTSNLNPTSNYLSSSLYPSGKPARALYDFVGEPSFNELTLSAGESFEILNEQLRGGWSLGLIRRRKEKEDGSSSGEGETDDFEVKRGLVPRGWYCYIQDFTISPNVQAVSDENEEVEGGLNSNELRNLPPLTSPPIMITGIQSSNDSRPKSKVESNKDFLTHSQASYRPTSSGQIGSADFQDPDPIAISLPISNSSNQLASALPARAVVGLDISGTPSRVIGLDEVTNLEGSKGENFKIGKNERAKLALSLMHERERDRDSNSTPKGSRFLGRSYERDRKISTSSMNQESFAKKLDRNSGGSSGFISNSNSSLKGEEKINTSMDSSNLSVTSPSPSTSSSFISFPFARSFSGTSSNGSNATTAANSIPITPSTIAGGGWRSTLFGGKSLNRFSNFVTSGVEDYVISNNYDPNSNSSLSASNSKLQSSSSFDFLTRSESDLDSQLESQVEMDSNCHFVEAGKDGPVWKSKSPNFYVAVHDPQKRSKMNGIQEYTVFAVSSIFPLAEEEGIKNGKTKASSHSQESSEDQDDDEESLNSLPYDPTSPSEPAGPILTVYRRYSQFSWLSQILIKRYPALILPPLPSKQYAGRFASDFIETRRSDLELWMGRIVRHPILRYSDALLFFLSCGDELEWKKRNLDFLKPISVVDRDGRHSNGITKSLEGPPAFFANTFHPEFNVEIEEAENEGREMERFLRANERAVNGGNQGAVALNGGVMGCLKSSREGDAGEYFEYQKRLEECYLLFADFSLLPHSLLLLIATSIKYRELSYSLLRLITGQGLSGDVSRSTAPATPQSNGAYSSSSTRSSPPNAESHLVHGPPMGKVGKKSENGATNEEGSWCWREGCQGE